MLKRKSELIVLSIVLALAFIAATSLAVVFAPENTNRIFSDKADTTAEAAITGNTSFGKLTNGSKYYYSSTTAGAADIAVTVNSSAAHGSSSNPFVISTKEQWVGFANVITGQTAGFTGSSKVWVLNADIDLAGNSVNAVGRHATGFQGTLYGNKHSIKNGTVAYQTRVDSTTHYSVGLFHYINGGKIYDLTIESSIKFTMKTNIPAGCNAYIGGLTARANNGYFVNIISKVNVDVRQTTATANGKFAYPYIGGIIGQTVGSCNMYKCSYNGAIYYKTATDSTVGNNGSSIGGLVGTLGAATTTIDQCSVAGTITFENNCVVIGSFCGNHATGANTVFTISNCYTSLNIKAITPKSTKDLGLITGESPGQTKAGTATYTAKITNVYVTGKIYTSATDTTGYVGLEGNENDGSVDNQKAIYTNIYTPLASTGTVYPANVNTAGTVSKLGSVSAVVTQANKNSSITSNFSLASSGAVTVKESFKVSFVKGAGATGGPADTTYSLSSSVQNKTGTASPSRTGYTFKGWSLVSPTGALSNSTPTTYSIPANSRGNINVYAVWELKDFSGSPSAAAIVYGANATFTAAAVSCPAGTTDSNLGVTVGYQWKNSSGTAISGATGSTYTLTTPNAGTHTYQVTVTATPKDGITPARSHTYTVTLTVNKQGVATPTVASGLVYNGKDQVGVTASNSLVTLGGITHSLSAGNFTATASLPNANYCWGSNGGTDSAQKTLGWSIAKATVAAPTITAGKTLTYNGAPQYPTTSTDTLYTVTNNGGKNAGSYTVSFNLIDTTNYRWADRTAGSSNESAVYTISWNIQKANVTVTAPSFTSNGVQGKVYVGQTVSDLTITQSSGTHVREGSSVNVEGEYAWELAANTRIRNKSFNQVFTVKFTPTDTDNYNATENVAVTVNPTQLYVNVQEVILEFINASGAVVQLNGSNYDGYNINWANLSAADHATLRSITGIRRNASSAIVPIPVDYNKPFALSALNVGRGQKVQSTVDDQTTLNWQLPTSYNVEFFTGLASGNEGSGSYGMNNPTVPAITSDVKVYLGYTGKPVDYTIVTVRQDLGANTPSNAQIIAAMDSPNGFDDMVASFRANITVRTATAAAGSRVSYPSQTIEGFSRKNSLAADGENTYISQDQAIFVLGEGKTVIVSYYERNTYTLTYTFSGGKSTNKQGQEISNRLSLRVKYGEDFYKLPTPTYDGYTFTAWYSESSLTNVVPVPDDMTMPARNLTLYAGRSAVPFTITFNYNDANFADQNIALPETYLNDLKAQFAEGTVFKDGRTYTVDEIINNGVIRLSNLTLEGFSFLGWYYTAEGDTEELTHRLTSITRTTAGDYELYAKWAPIVYNVTLDTQNSNGYSQSFVQITNLSEIPSTVGDFHGEDFDGIYDPADVPEGFYLPTRAGYSFLHWAFRGPDGTMYPAFTGSAYDVRRHGQTLYAVWQANPVHIEYADDVNWLNFSIAFKSSDAPNPDATYTLDQFNSGNYLYKDSTLTVIVTPNAGYDINYIEISGTGYNNGGSYTVRTYENDTIILDVQLVERRFNITYVWDGGSFVGDSEMQSYPRTFVLSDMIKLVGGKYVNKVGYTFNGWHLGSPDGQPQGSPRENISEIPASYLGAHNVVLYAEWTPAPVKMVYHNNYRGSDGKEVIFEDDGTDIVTGKTIKLAQPADDGFIPENYELIGWATEPNGDIKYNVDYKYVFNSIEDSYFEPLDTFYNVQPSANNENHLYAKWRLANLQFLTFEADNNNVTYGDGGSSYTGVDLTARPKFPYRQDSSLKLQFVWYKVDLNDPLWVKWSEADLEGLVDDEYNQALSNVELGIYKIPAGARPVLISGQMTDVAPEAQMHVLGGTGFLNNVNESGLYLCALEATGSYYTGSGGYKTSTINMYGQYNVIINKADLDQITLTSPSAPSIYNGQQQGIAVTWPANDWAAESGDVRVLPDGSKIKVNYKYLYNAEDGSEVVVENSVRNVGSYRVVASFEFLNDKGNYNTPDSLNGQFEISRLEINDVTYELQTLVDGNWVKVDSFTGNKYSRQPFRIVATPTNLMASDVGLVEIGMYYDGTYYDGLTESVDQTVAPSNVGEYYAYCDKLLGDSASNYSLSTSLPRREFSIVKADHNIKVTFENQTVTYDGAEHELAIKSIIENAIIENGAVVGGKNIVITNVDAENDTITLDDGCTITLKYSIAYEYVDARFDMENTVKRGGVYAGVYTVTVSFIDTDENAVNFNKLDDISAVLTVNQAPYRGDGKNVGLSDEQLQRYITVDGKKTPNPNGFGDNHTVDFRADTGYNPALKLDSNYFTVEYTREYKAQSGANSDKFVPLKDAFPLNGNGLPTFATGGVTKEGLNKDGTYRVTAAIKYSNIEYANNYLSISDYSVELKILPGEIDHIEVNYNQSEHESATRDFLNGDYNGYIYGDTFDFYEMGNDGYVVGIEVFYKAGEGETQSSETVDNNNVQFFNESGAAFEKFDRATIVGDDFDLSAATPIEGTDGYYKIKVRIYGAEGTLKVMVRQATLSYETIGFDDENDGNLQRVSGDRQWNYGFTYDGESRYPALSDNVENGAYNFVGLEGDVLVSGRDIKATYQHTPDKNVNAGSVWTDMPLSDGKPVGLSEVGESNIRVLFENKNTNYKALVQDDTVLNCRVNIEQKQLAASDIIWQYCNNDTFSATDTHTLDANANLKYHGQNGYYVRAVFRNLAQDNTAASDYYLTVADIKLTIGSDVQSGKSVKITNQGDYSVVINGLKGLDDTNANYANYKLPDGEALTANVTVDPAEVTLLWQPSNATLTFNGFDQLKEHDGKQPSVKASYTTNLPETNHDDSVSIIVTAIDGGTVANGELRNAGLYTLTAILADENYVASNATFDLTMNPYTVEDVEENSITWWYSNSGKTDFTEIDATVDANGLGYIGEVIPVFVQFKTIGEDTGDSNNNLHRVEVFDANGQVARNAGSYDMSLKTSGNYDLSKLTHNLVINKHVAEVVWAENQKTFQYDAQDHTITAYAAPVGTDAGPIWVLADATKRNANQGNADWYTTYARVADDYVDNYEFKDAVDGAVSFDWTITKKQIGVNWDTSGLVYNNGFDVTDWSYTVTDLEGDDNVDLQYDILIKTADGGEEKVRSMNVAGDYVIRVTGVTDSNYAFDNVVDQPVTVAKAKAVIKDVVYKEYANADNVTYQGNAHGLRNDKLTYTATNGDVTVAGKLEFVDGSASAIAVKGTADYTNYYPCVFTPSDTANYDVVEYNDLRIMVRVDSIIRLGFNNKELITLYAVNQTFRPWQVSVFFEYASYYEETVNNVTTSYGKRDAIGDINQVVFKYKGSEIGIQSGYTFKTEDLGEQEIYVSAYDGKTTRTAVIKITVSNAIPTSLTITNREELEGLTYYIGTKFDKSLVKFYATYKTESSNGEVSSDFIDVTNPDLTETGPVTIEFTYFTNTEAEVKAYITITVSPKEVINVADPSGTYRWLNGEPITPTIKQTNGKPLPDDITYRITDESGHVVNIKDEATYTIIVQFQVDESKYEPINSITATIVVKRIVAELDPSSYREPLSTRAYTGVTLTAADYELMGNIVIVDNEDSNRRYDIIDRSYAVNGQPVEGYVICDRGVYNMVASFRVRSRALAGEEELVFDIEHAYSIEITQADNEIKTFVINSWVYGVGSGTVTFDSSFGKDTVTYEYFKVDANNNETLASVDRLPTEIGRYRAVATIFENPNYKGAIDDDVYFEIRKPLLDQEADVNGEPLVTEDGKDIVEITGRDGVNPYYDLRVELLKDTSNVNIRKQVVVTGYDIDIVDAQHNIVENPGEYTVKLLLTEEQRNTKNFRNLKVYIVDEYGVAIEEVTNAKVDEDGYMVFTTSNFNGNFIVTAQDAAAIAQTAWVVGISIGGVIALAAIIILIIVVIKKKKEND